MEPTKSAYGKHMIDNTHGAVTALAYRTGAGIGGHTHLAFEYPESVGYTGQTAYRHVVFHLVAMGGACGQSCTGTHAGVLKQVPVGRGRFGYVGDKSAYKYAQRKAGANQPTAPQESYKLLPLGSWDRNLSNDDGWTTKKYRSRTVIVKPHVAKHGHLLCRRMAKGEAVEGIECERFHKLRTKGTNCVYFALQVLAKLGIESNRTLKFWAWLSPPEALRVGKLVYGGRNW